LNAKIKGFNIRMRKNWQRKIDFACSTGFPLGILSRCLAFVVFIVDFFQRKDVIFDQILAHFDAGMGIANIPIYHSSETGM
jgi:hypothetical protein